MKEKMNVLFISPFENMRRPVQKIAQLYPNIETTILCGNEDMGKRLALESYSANYDCIISRGNTATLIRQAVSIPVVEVKVTLNDVLGSLADAPELPTVVAAVGYNSVVSGMDTLKRFLPFCLEVFGFDTVDQLESVFHRLRQMDIHTIVCDTITYELASRQGFNAYILQSGEDSIRYAFDYVMLLYQSSSSMLEENQLLRRLASVNSESETVVFSQDRKLYYSSLKDSDSILFEHLRERLPDFETHDKFKIVKQQSGYLYRVSAKKVTIRGSMYYAYFISRRTPDMQYTQKGIRYLTEAEVRKEMDSSVFGIANLKNYYSSELNQALSRRNPVLIFGEVGVGKNHLAEMIYLNSQYTKNPFVFIDLPLMNKQTWNYLISRNESPLCDNSNTLFLKHIDALDNSQLSQLLAALVEGDVSKRNRIILSCSARRENAKLGNLLRVIDQLGCLTINMQPLQGQYGAIEDSVNLLLSDFREKNHSRVGAPEPGAMSLLLHYPWPQNYNQLIRVVNKVATLAGDGPITKTMVAEALTTEMFFTQGETDQSANTFLDLTKPLNEINADIVRILLEQNSGNQTLTAKSLGISRTTMWRMLRESKSPKTGD